MLVNNIIPFSIVDGPGNRLVIFLQECNINCLYCHNFETINKCINCMECIEGCPTKSLTNVNGEIVWNESTCIDCDACIYTCRHSATPKTNQYTPKQIADMIIGYKDFIDGITFSGGECTLQSDEIVEVIKLLKPYNINVLIDSNGTFTVAEKQELVDLADGFMIDVKSLHNNLELVGTDYDNKDLIDDLYRLHKLTELRTVDLSDEESSLTIAWLENYVSDKPEVNLKINKLSTANLKPERKAELDKYLQ